MVDQLKKEKDIKRINVSQAAGDLIEVLFSILTFLIYNYHDEPTS